MPVTQARDWRVYDWPARHAAAVELMRVRQPEIVMLGDSIVHFWGGDPSGEHVGGRRTAPEVWDRFFTGRRVVNLGYGWDRTENVLWRVENGELDGIDPKVVVVQIGTNNTAVGNSPEDIAAGIEAVCARIHEKLPRAKVLLFGILTRRDEKPERPSVTEKVNRILLDRLSDVSWLVVRDIGSLFRNPEGTPNTALFSDGVHVNAAGYEILGKQFRAEIASLTR